MNMSCFEQDALVREDGESMRTEEMPSLPGKQLTGEQQMDQTTHNGDNAGPSCLLVAGAPSASQNAKKSSTKVEVCISIKFSRS